MMSTLNQFKNWTNVNGKNFNDMASSASHFWSSTKSISYKHKDFTIPSLCIAHGVSRPHLSTYGFNDVISSNLVALGTC